MKKAFIIGDPVAHSRSPLIHGFWLKEFNLKGSYERIHVKPENIKTFMQSFKETKEFQGGNVTIPHKEAVMPFVDHLHEAAIRIGAVNTLWFENGQLHATNTDGMGFSKHLDQSHPNWEKMVQKVLILGAGGGARAIIDGLMQKGITEITVMNRSQERAETVTQGFGKTLRTASFNHLNDELKHADMVINTTALGMEGQPPLDLTLPNDNKQRVIADIVYVPLETELLKQARLKQYKCVNGLGMLLHQATPGFEKWFGKTPVVTDALHDFIVADLNKVH